MTKSLNESTSPDADAAPEPASCRGVVSAVGTADCCELVKCTFLQVEVVSLLSHAAILVFALSPLQVATILCNDATTANFPGDIR